jgi:hypothetical protein
MAVQMQQFVASYGSAGFANIAQWFSNSLKAVGLVRVASSRPAVAGGGNQAADYTGVANPVAASTALEWEIWRFDDALQATSPIYFRIYWRTGSGASTVVLALKVGTGWDTVSDVNGNTFTEQQLVSTTSSAGVTAAWCVVSGATNRITGVDYGSNHMIIFGIERLHNADGSDNDEGAFVFCEWGSATASHENQVISRPAVGANGNRESKVGHALMPRSTTTMYGADVAIGPIFPMRGKALYPSRNFIVVGKGDLASGGGFPTFDHYYGVAQKWYNCGKNQTLTYDSSGSPGHGTMMRFE